jgi:ABC-2 type transport system ATP-binding protein
VLTFSLDGCRTPAGELVATLAQLGALRDISIAEPAIEDVIARLYTGESTVISGAPA